MNLWVFKSSPGLLSKIRVRIKIDTLQVWLLSWKGNQRCQLLIFILHAIFRVALLYDLLKLLKLFNIYTWVYARWEQSFTLIIKKLLQIEFNTVILVTLNSLLLTVLLWNRWWSTPTSTWRTITIVSTFFWHYSSWFYRLGLYQRQNLCPNSCSSWRIER